jgi:hypothetical protein
VLACRHTHTHVHTHTDSFLFNIVWVGREPEAAAGGTHGVGHLPTHEISKNVEAVQVGVLAATVHITPCDRFAQLVRVSENRQHVVCRSGEKLG